MKTELTPEDLAKAIQFMKDNSIREGDVCLNRLIGWISAPRIDKELIEKGERTYPELKIGDVVDDGVNKRVYRGNGVWVTTLVHDGREPHEKI